LEADNLKALTLLKYLGGLMFKKEIYLTLIVLFVLVSCAPFAFGKKKAKVEEKPAMTPEEIQMQVRMKMSFAQEYYKNKNYLEAIPYYRTVIDSLEPDNKTAYKYLAYSYLKLNDPAYVDSALAVFHDAVKKYPDRNFAFSGLGYIFLKEQQLDSAAYYLSEAIARDTTDVQSAGFLSDIMIRERNYDSSIVLLKLITRHDKDDNDSWSKLAQLLEANRNHAELVDVYSNLYRLNPENHEYLLQKGKALAGNDQIDEATEILNEYITSNPEDYQGYRYLGLIYSMQGKEQEALEKLQKAVELNSADAELHCELAESYLATSNVTAARQCVNNAKQIDHSLARITVIEGDIKKNNAYSMVSPNGEIDYCTKEVFKEAYDIYRGALSDERWGPVARRKMAEIKDYLPSAEEAAAWKHLGKSCD
jgi:tetratricopeptide (TPR) repeat protein